MNPRGLIIGAALASAFLGPANGSATTWDYIYTGNKFTGVNTPFTTSDFISFQFISSTLLGPNLNDTPFPGITQWSLSVGPLSYSSANGVLYSINFSTNTASQITAWQFTTQTDVVAPGLPPPVYSPTPYVEEVFSFNLPSIFGVADGIYIPSLRMDSYYSYNSSDPGTWRITATPVPAALPLFAGGLGIVGALVRRRKRKNVVYA
jgi:hypothetical protein